MEEFFKPRKQKTIFLTFVFNVVTRKIPTAIMRSSEPRYWLKGTRHLVKQQHTPQTASVPHSGLFCNLSQWLLQHSRPLPFGSFLRPRPLPPLRVFVPHGTAALRHAACQVGVFLNTQSSIFSVKITLFFPRKLERRCSSPADILRSTSSP